MPASDLPVCCLRYSLSSGWVRSPARVIGESGVTLFVNGESWLTFACTPTDLEALAVGFLFNEGLLKDRSEIAAVDVCQSGTVVDVWLNQVVERPRTWRRTSGCTGGLTADTEEASLPGPLPPSAPLEPAAILTGMEQLLSAQLLYRETRGVHCSALSDGQAIRILTEDIGRHNTLDKLAGKRLLGGDPFTIALLLTTGRVSSEMLQKSARLGAPVVVSRTSPTTQSVELANRLGITLVGYARRGGFQVYSHSQRLTGAPALPLPGTLEAC